MLARAAISTPETAAGASGTAFDRFSPAWALLLLVVPIAWGFFPADCDGAVGVWDGIRYGCDAELTPTEAILPHHPLFHVLVLGATRVLQWCGVAAPGHLGARLVGGLGSFLVLWLVAASAGSKRRWVGLTLATAVLVSRGFVVETAAGENVLLGCAGALALIIESVGGARVGRLIALTVAALLLRQDNILVLPACVAVVAVSTPAGMRLRKISRWLAIAGAITLLGYVGAWIATTTDEGFCAYLLRFGKDAWGLCGQTDARHIAVHAAAFGAALIGRQWLEPGPHILVGAVYVLGLALAAWLWRGTDAWRRAGLALLLVFLVRFPFYWWFEPVNFEWQILTVILCAWFVARCARGTPATPRPARIVGAGIVLVLAAAVLTTHLPSTLESRSRTLAEHIDRALALAGPRSQALAFDKNSAEILRLRRWDWGYMVQDLQNAARWVMEYADQLNRPIVVVADRFVGDGMPFTRTIAADQWAFLDLAPETEGVQILRSEGHVFAFIVRPLPPGERRPARQGG